MIYQDKSKTMDTILGMNHDELMQRAEKWLRKSKRCSVILREFVCYAVERPDLIAWKYGASILIECKTSRADFYREIKKPSRRNGIGMGRDRYYFVPANLINESEMPENWGLIFCYENYIKVIKEAIPFPQEIYTVAEYPLLLSIARRVEYRGWMENIRDGSVVNIGDVTAPSTPRIVSNPDPPRPIHELL